MKINPEKDLYSILGVASNATAEEIREAYISRTRVIHPDRFDQNRQPQEWKKANEMLAEINEAYSILNNKSSRAHYDDLQARTKQRPSTDHKYEPEPEYSSSIESAKQKVGYATYGDLPPDVQSRLLKRQRNKGMDQFQLRLSSIGWNYFFIVLLLCWYLFLFTNADGAKWKVNSLLWYTGITLLIGGLIGRNCITILRWAKAKLKSFFYVTPIYYIKTEFDVVSFRPLWTIKDISVTQNYEKGSYKNSIAVLKFDGYDESLTLSSKEQVEDMFNLIQRYTVRVQKAYESRDQSYFINNDDFYNVSLSGVPTTKLLSKRIHTFIYSVSILLC